MLDRILPARIDNRYRAHVLALWLFVPIAFMKVGVSLAHRFEADGGARSISTTPLDTSPPSARPSFVPPAARWALATNHGRSSS
jgi:hypothetical protein